MQKKAKNDWIFRKSYRFCRSIIPFYVQDNICNKIGKWQLCPKWEHWCPISYWTISVNVLDHEFGDFLGLTSPKGESSIFSKTTMTFLLPAEWEEARKQGAWSVCLCVFLSWKKREKRELFEFCADDQISNLDPRVGKNKDRKSIKISPILYDNWWFIDSVQTLIKSFSVHDFIKKAKKLSDWFSLDTNWAASSTNID